MNMKRFGMLMGSLSAIMMFLASIGCETRSASENTVTITPSATSLLENQSATFTASGGYDQYEWSLSNQGIGMLTNTKGTQTTYINRHNPASPPVIQILTVRSTIAQDSGSAGTNYAHTAEAHIEHLQTPGTEGSETPTTTSSTSSTSSSSSTTTSFGVTTTSTGVSASTTNGGLPGLP